MKPRIVQRGGLWWCVTPGTQGCGRTQQEAYGDWHEQRMLIAALTRRFGHATDTRNGVLPL